VVKITDRITSAEVLEVLAVVSWSERGVCRWTRASTYYYNY
jgi:hypothetical protein